jgi:hypothetical protein
MIYIYHFEFLYLFIDKKDACFFNSNKNVLTTEYILSLYEYLVKELYHTIEYNKLFTYLDFFKLK